MDIKAIMQAFLAPFTKLKSRKGAGNKNFQYVDFHQVLQRILGTVPDFGWEILDCGYQAPETYQKREYGSDGQATGRMIEATRNGFFWCYGRLTIPGLMPRDGYGTQVWENEDSPKGAETDAFKRAAVKFGIGLHLYEKDEQQQAGTRPVRSGSANPYYEKQQQTARKPIENRGSQSPRPLCPECNAPEGRDHVKGCSLAPKGVSSGH